MRAQIENGKVVAIVTGHVADGIPVPIGLAVEPGWFYSDEQFTPPTAPTLEDIKVGLCKQVDDVADVARLTIAGDPLRMIEYERAAIEAKAYKDAGYSGTVPPAVASWADAKGWSGKDAADNILAEAATWNQALYGIRDMRLKGKEAIRNAADIAAAQAAADAAITQLRAVVASVGNAK